MKQKYPKDMEFVEELSQEEREHFLSQPKEVVENAVTENKIAEQEEKLREQDSWVNQLTDRIASESFQG